MSLQANGQNSSYSSLPTFSSHSLLNAKHFQINYFIHCSSVESLLDLLCGNSGKLNKRVDLRVICNQEAVEKKKVRRWKKLD